MRDLFIVLLLAGALPFVFKKPQVGVLLWVWMSIMNPHKLTYGFAYDFPFLDIIAGITIISLLINRKKLYVAKYHLIIGILACYYFWTCLTTVFAVEFVQAFEKWLAYSKTILMVAVILMSMNNRTWTFALIWVFVLSLAFTGFKGGIFTVMTGGGYRIWGPPQTAWGDNNGVSIAMLIGAPLIWGLRYYFTDKLTRSFLLILAGTFFLTLLGTQSRGGLVGAAGMLCYAVYRSKYKVTVLPAIAVLVIAGLVFMPESWTQRMSTIANYEEDASASSRIIQWKYAIDIAGERPLFGNGFNAFFHQPYVQRYLHDDINRAVHSNYFEVLGEHGYIGLFVYLLLGIVAVLSANRVSKKRFHTPQLKRSCLLLYMTQFSIVGYAANGLTVNMATLDLYYYVLAIVVLLIGQIKVQEASINAVSNDHTPPNNIPEYSR
ncbi:MAG: putative O-glycosylation ligase, exosortase A system-associated [Pseudomonadales bacterium]|nr:putative O-glycosylation ligase, exosortase A system-associated [Pseudomonadales bacterium]